MRLFQKLFETLRLRLFRATYHGDKWLLLWNKILRISEEWLFLRFSQLCVDELYLCWRERATANTDGAGSDLLYVGVLDEKSVLEIFPGRFELIDILFLKYASFWDNVLVQTHRLHSLTLPLSERVRSFHSAVSWSYIFEMFILFLVLGDLSLWFGIEIA